jgi:hypothetical protein
LTKRPALDAEDVDDLEEAPDDEVEAAEEQILDQATAARTIAELKAEIETLRQLEGLCHISGFYLLLLSSRRVPG